MICPNCGANTPDGLGNCVKCGAIFKTDYQQMYYKQKVEQKDDIKNSAKSFAYSVENGLDSASKSISNGFNNVGKSINQGFNSLGRGINNATNSVNRQINKYQISSEDKKKGDDAYVMSIVALVLSLLGFNVVSLVLGIVALKWAKTAYSVTKDHNHELAKTISTIAIVVSSIEIGAIIIFAIVRLVAYLFMYSSGGSDLSGIVDEYMAIRPLF